MSLLNLIIFSGIAGLVGTGFGGIIGIILGKKSLKIVSTVLAFASGIMISVSVFDLIPEAYAATNYNVYYTVLGILLGVIVISLFNFIIDDKTQETKEDKNIHSTLDTLRHEDSLLKSKQNANSLLKAGFIMFLAITLHNLPEGMAIGASGAISQTMGIAMALLITIHNIPEGMSVALPLTAGGLGKLKTFLLTSFAGSITIIGGLIGYYVGSLGGIATALALSFAAGSMLYVTFCEIIPQSVLMNKNKLPSLFSIIGILVGFIFINLL